MESKNETIADIVAEMRKYSQDKYRLSAEWGGEKGNPGMFYLQMAQAAKVFADRIEAVHAREVQDALDTGGYVEACRARKKLVDNGAKMREALEHIAAIPMPPPNEMAQGIAVEMREVAIAALAAPPRNCDVGTAEVQAKRKMALCDKQQGCGNCSLNKVATLTQCALAWAQMPYEEGGSK